MPTPNKGESEADFVSRCMGDPEARSTFPDEEQRAAFCYAQHRKQEAVAPEHGGILALGKKLGLDLGGMAQLLQTTTKALQRIDAGLEDPGPLGKALLQAMERAPESMARALQAVSKVALPAIDDGSDEVLAAYEDQGLLKGGVLHYGCGRGAAAAAGFDPRYRPAREALRREHDTVVLDRLDAFPPEQRDEVLLAGRGCLRNSGRLLVSVREESCRETDELSYVGPQSGWTGEEWWEFFRDQGWSPRVVEGVPGRLAWELEPAYVVAADEEEAGAGSASDAEQPVYSSLLAEAHAIARRAPVE